MGKSRADLISDLSSQLKPVKVLSPIGPTILRWFVPSVVASLAVAGLLSLIFAGFDFSVERVLDAKFIIEQALLLSSSLAAGLTALMISRPGIDPTLSRLLSFGTLLLWSVLGMTVLDSFLLPEFAVETMFLGYTCLTVSTLSAIPVGISIHRMVTKGYVMNKPMALFFSILAATSMGSFALQFYCPMVTGAIKLVWHILPIYILSLVGVMLLQAKLKSK